MERVSRILDHNGQPIRIKELGEPQSARIGSLHREFANHPTRGITPSRLASIMEMAEQGDLTAQCDLYEDMEEKDAHIFAEMSKRKRALLGLEWQIVAPERKPTAAEKRAADMLEEWLRDMEDFEDHLFDLADGIGVGYSQMEIEWRLEQKLRLPSLTHQPPRWFTVDKKARNRLLLRTDDGQGEALQPFGWLSHVHKAKSGYLARAGLHRVLAWPFLFKNYSVRDLAEFLEIYGLPVRLGTYPGGASDQEKSTLLNAVINIGHNAAGIIPEGMAIEFKDAAKGASDPFMAMMTWCEASQSKAILGGTLTTTAEATGLGSNLGDVHNEVRHDLLVSDARQIAGTLSRDLLWPLVALNIGGIAPGRCPRFRFVTDEPEDLKARADRDKVLFDMGMRLSDEKFTEVYGEGYERFDNKPPADQPPPEPQQPATAAAKAEQPGDDIDGFVDQLQGQAQPAIDDMLDRIKQLLGEVESLEAFEARLAEAFSYLDPDELTEVMQLGLSAAELAGQYDIDRQS